MHKALIHIRCNTGKVRRERRNGRDVIIVPSYTLPSGVVMNRIRYDHDEIEKAYPSFERSPAPLGHPTIDGMFVSAKDPEGLARGWVGSWNENVRREGNRIAIDKVIDVDHAKQLEGGKAILAAIEAGQPIHSSTGLFAMLEPLENDEHADFTARDIVGDHDAWLLGETGAATPEQGVGILVNSQTGETEADIPVINSAIEDDIDREQMWALESLLRGQERKEHIPLLKRILSFIEDVRRGEPAPQVNAEQEFEAMDKAQFDALTAKVDALANAKPLTAEDITTIVANAMKPVTDRLDAQDKAASDKAEADRLVLVNQVVEAEILTEDEAKDVPAAALTKLLSSGTAPKQAFRVNTAGFKPQGEKPGFTAPKGE